MAKNQIRQLTATDATVKSMRSNRGKDTGPELVLRRALWASGARGYRVNLSKLPGKPDIVFTRAKLAVFVHGCFWHGCERCSHFTYPKANAEFWRAKIERTRERDKENEARLCAMGYTVLVVRECELKEDIERAVERLLLAVCQRRLCAGEFVSSRLKSNACEQVR
jgi:DNA mismatch endonuclease (patch repair protein)